MICRSDVTTMRLLVGAVAWVLLGSACDDDVLIEIPRPDGAAITADGGSDVGAAVDGGSGDGGADNSDVRIRPFGDAAFDGPPPH
jgi:hypothetical protein